MRTIFTFFFCFVCSLNVIGQKNDLGKVTKSELLLKHHDTDTSAPAAVIFKKAKTMFSYTEKAGFTSVTTFQVKIKIFKKEGLEWANFKIPYYTGYQNLEDELVDVISGFTYNLDNDKIAKTRVTGESKFKRQINENWEEKSVTFPNVKVGSIIELEYKFKSQNLSILPEFQLQYNIPVDFAEYLTEIPEFYIFKGIKKGFVTIETEEKIEHTSQSFSNKYNQTQQLNYRQVRTKYTAKEIPALQEESYVNNIDNYFGKIEHELQIIRMPEEEPKQIATTWESVAKSIFDDKDFKDAITRFDYFANDIKSTIIGTSSDEEKAKKIFSYVKSRMNWNGRFGYYPRNKMGKVYSEKVGNIAEINLMLIAMLRMAGIQTEAVLVSTRQNGFADFPNRTLFNYVIAAAEIDGKTILMDATSKLADLNVLPLQALNWKGRLIRNDGTSSEIELMPKSASKESINIMGVINTQGEVTGKIRHQYFDYNAFVFRDKYNGVANVSYIEKLEKHNQGLGITDYDVQNSLDLDLPIVENYSFTSTNSVEIIGDKIYISPFLFFAKTENPFKQESREYPVDFVYPSQDKFNISLTIPDGYVIEALPLPKVVAMPENLGNFKYNISSNGNQIQLLFTHDTNQAIIGSEYYEELKAFYKELIQKQTEKVVLKKV